MLIRQCVIVHVCLCVNVCMCLCADMSMRCCVNVFMREYVNVFMCSAKLFLSSSISKFYRFSHWKYLKNLSFFHLLLKFAERFPAGGLVWCVSPDCKMCVRVTNTGFTEAILPPAVGHRLRSRLCLQQSGQVFWYGFVREIICDTKCRGD